MELKDVLASAAETCKRCGESGVVVKNGLCDRCDSDVDQEYYELYNIKTMENC